MLNPSNLTAEIASKDQYGVTVTHPVNVVAKLFAEIAGTKTLTERTISLMHELGVEIVIDGKARS